MRTSLPPARAPHSDVRWHAVQTCDAAADGTFVYAVRSTGVYCRPHCASRQPRRENVFFYATSAHAEDAGFRACRRCRPADAAAPSHEAAVAAACRTIETAETAPHLADLAAATELNPYHFHRVFKAATGVTPRAYAQAHRRVRVQAEMTGSSTVTAAMHSAGFGSSAGFYGAADGGLGMRPSAFRRGGTGEAIRFAVADCSLGKVLVAATDKGVCTIALGDDADFAAQVRAVVAFVDAEGPTLDLPLDIRGTAFQQRVWRALRDVPSGTTLSYAALAARLGVPKATRAVASAVAANSIAVAVPCHRVIRGDGSLSGYRWGVARKRALLERERAADSRPPSPQTSPTKSGRGSKPREGLFVLRRFALDRAKTLLAEIERVAARAPFRHMVVPGGGTMSAAMTNCGARGWVTDRSGYRYETVDPATGQPWPAMPPAFRALAAEAALAGGFGGFEPDACLVNRYEPGARMGLHQDRDERDQTQPIVSVSLGLRATFLWGGARRRDAVAPGPSGPRRRRCLGRGGAPVLPRDCPPEGWEQSRHRPPALQPDLPRGCLVAGQRPGAAFALPPGRVKGSLARRTRE